MSRYISVKGDTEQTVQHRVVAEKILGKKLPNKAVVHHIDGNGKNNNPENLVICPSQAYHKLLHRREKALDACGNANWMRCIFCKIWDSPENIKVRFVRIAPNTPRAFHPKCQIADAVRRQRIRRAKDKCAS